MNSIDKFERFNYIKEIVKNFPNTLFQFTFEKENELRWSKKRTFKDSDKFSFFKKDSYFRSNLWNETTDEIRLDFDYSTLEENLYRMRGVVQKLESVGICKYELYLTGGKGTHLTFRFDFRPFLEFDRENVRNELFNALELGIKTDTTLFQTIQVIGLEGFNHRKTKLPKQRIFFDNNCHILLENNLNLLYLSEDFVNKIPKNTENAILYNLQHISTKDNSFNCDLTTKNNNINQKKLIWHILRFKEIYLNLKDGRKRLLDMLTRYLLLTIKNIDEIEIILKDFCNSVKINIDVDSRIKSTKSSMKANAIFIYSDVLTKEEFYKGWSQAINFNEPFNNK